MAETIEKPIIAKEILEQISAQTFEEKQVIVQCMLPASPFEGNLARIWPSTFLIDESNEHRSSLIHAENISMFPIWTEMPPNNDFWFTLIFSGLPSNCKNFDLKEIIPQPGGFHVRNIRRNGTDVYRVKLSEN